MEQATVAGRAVTVFRAPGGLKDVPVHELLNLTHPHVCKVLEVEEEGEEGDGGQLTCDAVLGPSLTQALDARHAELPWRPARLRVLCEVASALRALHGRGLVAGAAEIFFTTSELDSAVRLSPVGLRVSSDDAPADVARFGALVEALLVPGEPGADSVAELGRQCAAEDPEMRPAADDIVGWLEDVAAEEPADTAPEPPPQRPFSFRAHGVDVNARLPEGASFDEDSDLTLDAAAVQMGEEIGHGAFSRVFRAVVGGREVAVKETQVAQDGYEQYVAGELALLKSLTHPHLLGYHGACIVDDRVMVATELCRGGDLRHVLAARGSQLLWSARLRVAHEVASAIAFLHARHVLHRDIKTDNVLFVTTDINDSPVRLCDLGFARGVDDDEAEVEQPQHHRRQMTVCGTDEFMAPELHMDEAYDGSADVFSFGVLLCELVTGKAPEKRQPQDAFAFDTQAFRGAVPPGVPPGVASMVELAVQCCSDVPEERPTAADAEEWLADVCRQAQESAAAEAEQAAQQRAWRASREAAEQKQRRRPSRRRRWMRRASLVLNAILGSPTRSPPAPPTPAPAPAPAAVRDVAELELGQPDAHGVVHGVRCGVPISAHRVAGLAAVPELPPHARLLPLLGVVPDGGGALVVTDEVRGGPLQRVVEQLRLTAEQQRAIEAQCREALALVSPRGGTFFLESSDLDNISVRLLPDLGDGHASLSFDASRLPQGVSFDEDSDLTLDAAAVQAGLREEIGHGAFSRVFRAVVDGREVAVKETQVGQDGYEQYVAGELALLKSLTHPHLLGYHGACVVGDRVMVATELCRGGDLRHVLAARGSRLLWSARLRVAHEVASAIAFLHARHVLHRDIKTDNVLFVTTDINDSPVRVCDLGFARGVDDDEAAPEQPQHHRRNMTVCGTDEFMAPEMQLDEAYDGSADVFSFGVLLCELVTGKAPEKRRPQDAFAFDTQAFRGAVPPGVPPGVASMVELAVQCCSDVPEERPTAADAEEWLADVCRQESAAAAAAAEAEQAAQQRAAQMVAAERARVRRERRSR